VLMLQHVVDKLKLPNISAYASGWGIGLPNGPETATYQVLGVEANYRDGRGAPLRPRHWHRCRAPRRRFRGGSHEALQTRRPPGDRPRRRTLRKVVRCHCDLPPHQPGPDALPLAHPLNINCRRSEVRACPRQRRRSRNVRGSALVHVGFKLNRTGLPTVLCSGRPTSAPAIRWGRGCVDLTGAADQVEPA
jgi:hypothetical protein